MKITIDNKKITGMVSAAPYMPLMHRYLISQALTPEHDQISISNASTGIRATYTCLSELGFLDTIQTNYDGINKLPCGESSLTYKLIIPIAAAMGCKCEIFIAQHLMDQTMANLFKILKIHGIHHEISDNNKLNIWGCLTAGTYILPKGADADLISGLLFALPLLKEKSSLMIEGQLENKEGVLMTLKVLSEAGIDISYQINDQQDDKLSGKGGFIGASFKIPGSQTYNMPSAPVVEGDWASAAYLLVAGAIGGGPVVVSGLNMLSSQKERVILDILKASGAHIEYGMDPPECSEQNFFTNLRGKNINGILYNVNPSEAQYVKITGRHTNNAGQVVLFKEKLNPFDIDAGDIPKLIPALALLGSVADGISCIRNVFIADENTGQGQTNRENANAEDSSWVHEESQYDSAARTVIETLENMGIMVWESEENIYIEGDPGYEPLSGGYVDGGRNSQVIMMECAASCICRRAISIYGAEYIEKADPAFFDRIQSIQIED